MKCGQGNCAEESPQVGIFVHDHVLLLDMGVCMYIPSIFGVVLGFCRITAYTHDMILSKNRKKLVKFGKWLLAFPNNKDSFLPTLLHPRLP